MKTVGGTGLGVVAGDVLALRGTGLAAAETWALLCQAAQALQDLFLSNGGVVGGSRAGPVVTPHTIELTARGRVLLLQAPPDTARAYLPPEYRPGRVYSDTDSEKMWMYSLGRALLDTTPRATALTGTVSVSPSSALQSVLAAMTEPDPRRRASLMNLLDVISEYCRTRLQSRPFTYIVMDMHREVVRSAQYAARKRAVLQSMRSLPVPPQPLPSPQQQQQHILAPSAVPTRQNPPPTTQQQQQQQPSRHRVKGALFKAQSRNSRSQPNLLSLANPDYASVTARTTAKCSATGDIYEYYVVDARNLHQRTNSQPDCCIGELSGNTMSQARSSTNLPAISASMHGTNNNNNNADIRNTNILQYGDPIYSLPVKPFLSSQDVRNAARQFQRPEVSGLPVAIGRSYCGATAATQPTDLKCLGNAVARGQQQLRNTKEDLYATSTKSRPGPIVLQRQHSSPQFSSSRSCVLQQKRWEFANSLPESRSSSTKNNNNNNNNDSIDISNNNSSTSEVHQQQQQQETGQKESSEARLPYVPRGPPPPKPPRINTSLKKAQAAQAALEAEKPQSRDIKNGPRARRGQPVQRAPSRLYRTVNGPTRSFNKTQCVGPEFVVRANQPVKLLTVGDFKMSNIGRLTVILLTGQRLEVTCDPQKITAGELFQAIVQMEGIEENFTLGLAALLAGDFAMLPLDTKLNKVAPPGWLNSGKSKTPLGLPTTFILYLRLRFFLPSLRGIRSWTSKHLLYLQLRRCILEQQLVCPLTQLINLTGLALQAEFGNYSANEHGCGDYFLLEHYVPESLILNSEEQQYRHPELPDSGEALRKRLQQAHRERRGLDANKAEEMFVTHAQTLTDYGAHYYIATVDSKELEKIVARQKKCADQNQQQDDEQQCQQDLYIESENIYDIDKCSDYPIYGKIDFNNSEEPNLQGSPFTDEQKIMMSKSPSNAGDKIYSSPNKMLDNSNNKKNANSKNKIASKTSKFKRSDSDVWLAIYSEGLKVFERGGRLRERLELAKFQWKDIQTLSYGKNYLTVYTRINGKRCKFKLRMDHRKSYYAFMLTSLHHQFFLKLRSELTSLQGLTKDFGVPLTIEPNSPQPKTKAESAKTKISIADSVKKHHLSKYPMHIEEQQNKENENPLKDAEDEKSTTNGKVTVESLPTSPENNALYGQVSKRLEPEGESRDTEDESDHALHVNKNTLSQPSTNRLQVLDHIESDKLYNYENIGIPYADEKEEYVYTIPKSFSTKDVDRLSEKIENPEDLYAAINKSGLPKKTEFIVPNNEQWKEIEVQKNAKIEGLSIYETNHSTRNNSSVPGRLEVKADSRSIYGSFVRRNPSVTDDLELLSLKSETTSIPSTSAKSTGSPIPEAYVLNTDLRTAEETFRIPDETMSTSLMARLDEISFAEERILCTIKLERGHGGSIGLQVTEGNDGGVYVQAVSVGGSADMAGNVNKGDRIVAINGQSLLNIGYEESLKLLQSSSETVELVLSQVVQLCDEDIHEPIDNNYLESLRLNVPTVTDNSAIISSKWLQKTTDVASVQNTSSAYSSAASSAMGNHNVNSLYVADVDEINALHSASMLLSLEDLDVSRTNESSVLPPPVPPRRKRSKSDTRRPSPTQPCATKPERKQRPAPLPPTRSRTGKKTPSPTPNNTSIIANSNYSLEYSLDNHDEISWTTSINGNNDCKGYGKSDNKNNSQNISKQLENCGQECYDLISSRSSSPYSKSPESSKYPPLYFTFEDYKKVIDESPSKNDMTSENILEQIEETTKKIEKISEVVEEVAGQVVEISENIEKISEQATSPFIENVLFENEREEIYFRVTTTNRPFEKCLGEWNTLGNEKQECEEEGDEKEECIDRYMFEDYIDRSNKINRPHILKLNEEFISRFQEDNSQSTEKSTTRVRFIIESPSTSTPDIDIDDDATNYQELVEQKFLHCPKSSLQLFEVTDDEAEAFDKTATSITEIENKTDSLNKFNLEITEDEDNISDSLYGLTESQINDSYSEWEEDVDIYSSITFTEDEAKINIENDLSKVKGTVLYDKQNSDSESNEEEKIANHKTEESSKNQTILIDTSFYNLAEEDEWEKYLKNFQVNLKDDETQQNISKFIKPLAIYGDLAGIDDRDDTIDDLEDNNKVIEEKTIESNDLYKNRKNSKIKINNSIPVIEISPAEDKPVPENVLRNFFLETMLSSDNLSKNVQNLSTVNCEVIATHLKQDPNVSLEEQQSANPPTVAKTVVATKKELALKNNSRIESAESDEISKAVQKINENLNSNKSVGEVKGDVLNELLTNFSTIKLKPVKSIVHRMSPLTDFNEADKEIKKNVEFKTDENNETWRVNNVSKDEEIMPLEMDSNLNLLTGSTATGSSNDIAHVNKDTSAIAEEASHTTCSYNDNKATIPVVVNEDQPRESVSIIPGSVKNFVKYYEIQSEICSIAKIKDNLFKKQSERAREKRKTKLTKTNEKAKKSSKRSAIPKTEVKVSEETSKFSAQNQPTPINSPIPRIQKQSCLKTEPSPKSERKKSVQFDNENVIIYPLKKEQEKQKDEDEGTISSLLGGIKTKLKRNKSPVRSSVNKIDQQNGLKLDQHCSDGAAIICIQKSPETRAVACSAIPGNRSFLPHTETLQSNQTIVFYCTI